MTHASGEGRRKLAICVLPPRRPQASVVVVVKSGDTLHGIARRHHVPAMEVYRANDLKSASLKVGQRLVIPARV